MSFFENLFSGSRARGQTELQKHWLSYTDWLRKKLPLYNSYLNAGASEQEIAVLKSSIPVVLPEHLIELYKLNNGDMSQQQELPVGSFMQFEFLSISRLLEEYNRLSKVNENHSCLPNSAHYSSYSNKTVKQADFNTKWIPLFADGGGNFIAIDLDPDENGVCGQIINVGRDEYMKFQIAKCLLDFLAFISQRVESGKCDGAIVQEDDGGYSYGLRGQSHLLDDLRHIIVEGQD